MSQDTTQAAQEFESSIAKYFKAGGLYPAFRRMIDKLRQAKFWYID